MASLTLKNLPEILLRDLRRAAERDRRSLNQEVIHLLEGALHARTEAPARKPEIDAQIAAWRRLAGRWESEQDTATETRQVMKRRTSGRAVDF